MSEHIEHLKSWAESFREDVLVVKAVVEAGALDKQARKFAAAALNYLVTRMDLVPDWSQNIGILDDAMILRICLNLGSGHGLDKGLGATTLARASAMARDVKAIEAFLGKELYARLHKYCTSLATTPVRGRSTDDIVDDEALRKALWNEIQDELGRLPATSFDGSDHDAVKLRSYLHHKLTS